MATPTAGMLSKVPAVTLGFWVIKGLATTLGETGGDALSMQLGLGYAVSTLVFLALFAATLTFQLRADRFQPIAYWSVVVATTTVGTTASDFFDRTLGLGYVVSSVVLLLAVMAILGLWLRIRGRIAVDQITDRRDEIFYWLTILISNTLGTALGDFAADDAGLGFGGGALVFTGLLVLVAGAHYFTRLPSALLFWTAYVLTRPLGATLGDTLTKPVAAGGLALGQMESSLVMVAAIMLGVFATVWLDQRRTRQ